MYSQQSPMEGLSTGSSFKWADLEPISQMRLEVAWFRIQKWLERIIGSTKSSHLAMRLQAELEVMRVARSAEVALTC